MEGWKRIITAFVEALSASTQRKVRHQKITDYTGLALTKKIR